MAQNNDSKSLRYAMMLPMVLMIASVITGCLSYSDAKTKISEDLNSALASLVAEKSGILCRPDTISAIKSMDKAVGQPICYRASDLNFSISGLADNAYYSLRLTHSPSTGGGHFIESDSIMIYDKSLDIDAAIELKGYVDCTMATVFSISDKTIPGSLMTLSLLSMMSLWYYRQRKFIVAEPQPFTPDLEDVKLTPMQRQLVEMILSAPEHKVSKRDICMALWGNKSNAEESLYTLVRRSKQALAEANFEIICNRGESYEIQPKC